MPLAMASRIIRLFLPASVVQFLRDLLNGSPFVDILHHALHGRRSVMIELLESFTKVVQPGFSIRRLGETMFRAATAAHIVDIALAAPFRERSFFRCSECFLSLRIDHTRQSVIQYVAEAIRRVHEMVAGINVAIVFEYQIPSAASREIAHTRSHPCPGAQDPLKIHDKERVHHDRA